LNIHVVLLFWNEKDFNDKIHQNIRSPSLWLIDLLINWCLKPTLTKFQIYYDSANPINVFPQHHICVQTIWLYVQIKENLKW